MGLPILRSAVSDAADLSKVGRYVSAGQDILPGLLAEGARGAVLMDRALDDERRVFELAFGFIPAINVGTAMGIEQPFVRFVADALLDPLNYLTSGYKTAAYTARAAEFLSREKRVMEFAKGLNAAAIAKRDSRLVGRFVEMAKRGDVKGLREFGELLTKETPELSRFFRGREGRAIKRALEGADEALVEGATAQARAGQRHLVGFRIPFTDEEVTLVRGDWLYGFGESIDGKVGEWFKSWGAKRNQAMQRALQGLSQERRIADEISSARAALAEIDHPETRAAAEKLGKLEDEVRAASAKAAAADARFNVLKGSPETAVARLEGEATRVAESVALGGAKALDHLGIILAQIGRIADDAPALMDEALGDVVGASLARISSATARSTEFPVVQTLKDAVQAQVDAVRAGEKSVSEALGSDALYRAVKDTADAATAAGHEHAPLYQQILDQLPGVMASGRAPLEDLEEAQRTIVQAVDRTLPAVTESLKSLKAVPQESLRLYSGQVQGLFQGLVNSAAIVAGRDTVLARNLYDSLRSAFPGLLKRGLPQEVAVALDSRSAKNDILAAMNPAFSSDLGGPGRSIAGAFGDGFSAAGLPDQHLGFFDSIVTRIGAWFRLNDRGFAKLSGRRGEAQAGRRAVDKVPVGFSNDAGRFTEGEAAGDTLYRASLDTGRESIQGALTEPKGIPSAIPRAKVYQSEAAAADLGIAHSPDFPDAGYVVSRRYTDDQARGVVSGSTAGSSTLRSPGLDAVADKREALQFKDDLTSAHYIARAAASGDVDALRAAFESAVATDAARYSFPPRLAQSVRDRLGSLSPENALDSFRSYVAGRRRHLGVTSPLGPGAWGTPQDIVSLDPAEIAVFGVRKSEIPGGALVEKLPGGWRLHSDAPAGALVSRNTNPVYAFAPQARGLTDLDTAAVQTVGAQAESTGARWSEIDARLGIEADHVTGVGVGPDGAAEIQGLSIMEAGAEEVRKAAAARGLLSGAPEVQVFTTAPGGRDVVYEITSSVDAQVAARAIQESGLTGPAASARLYVTGPAGSEAKAEALAQAVGGAVERRTYGRAEIIRDADYERILERAGAGPGGRPQRTLRQLVAESGAAVHGPGFARTARKVGDVARRFDSVARGGSPDALTGVRRAIEPGAPAVELGNSVDSVVLIVPEDLARADALPGTRGIAAGPREADDVLADLESRAIRREQPVEAAEAVDVIPTGRKFRKVRVRTYEGDWLVREADGSHTLRTPRGSLHRGLDFVDEGEPWVEEGLVHNIGDPGLANRFERRVAEAFGVAVDQPTEMTKAQPIVKEFERVGGNVRKDVVREVRLTGAPARTTLYAGKDAAEKQASGYRYWARVARGLDSPADSWAGIFRRHRVDRQAPGVLDALRRAFPELSAKEIRDGKFVQYTKLDRKALFDRLHRFETAMSQDPAHGATSFLPPGDWNAMVKVAPERVGVVEAAVWKGAKPAWNRSDRTLTFLGHEVRVVAKTPEGSVDDAVAWIDALENPNQIPDLDPAMAALIDETNDLMHGMEDLGHGMWWHEIIPNYLDRIVRFKAGRDSGIAQRYIEELIQKHAGARKTTRFAKPRFVPFFRDLVELEKRGVLTVEKDPRRAIETYLTQWAQVAANQRLVDTMARNRTIEGLPVLAKRSRIKSMLTTVTPRVRQTLERYLDLPTKDFPVLSDYLIHPDFQYITKLFGPQTMRAAIRSETNPVMRFLQYANLHIKGALLSFSFFHAVALHQSIGASIGAREAIKFGRQVANRHKAMSRLLGAGKATGELGAMDFLSLWGEAGGLVEYAIRNGLQLDTFERLASQGFNAFLDGTAKALRGAGDAARASGKALTPGSELRVDGPGSVTKGLVSAIDGSLHLNRFVHRTTWEIIHNSGKVLVGVRNLEQAMKRFPEAPIDVLAKEAMAAANRQMGGLNWRKIFGDSRARASLQMMLLAPDWTLANLAVARDVTLGFFPGMVKKGADGRFLLPFRDLTSQTTAGYFGRRYWMNFVVAGFLTSQLMNLALHGHLGFDLPGLTGLGAKDVGPMDIYTGQRDPRNGEPVFFHTGKQFHEPFQLLSNPVRFVQTKASPFAQAFAGLVVQRDRFGIPIALPDDSVGVAVLKNVGHVVGRLVPIPAAEAKRAASRVASGQYVPTDLINPFTSSFDLTFRRKRTKKDARTRGKAPSRGQDIMTPSAWDRAILPDRETRYVPGIQEGVIQ